MPISATEAIPLAFEHAKRQLFQPFRFWQWTRLAVVGLLAGEMSSGGGLHVPNFNVPSHTGSPRHLLAGGLPNINPATLAVLIGILVVAGLFFLILFMYISSVMRFVLFDSIIARECHIREGWRRRQGEGWKYFLWQLAYMIAVWAGLIVLVGIPAGFAFLMGWFKQPSQHILPLVLGGIALFFLLLLLIVAMTVIVVLTKDFIVPQMAMENITVMEGWRRLWPMLKAEKGGYAGYIGMKILLAIGASIVLGIATIILALVVAVPAVALGILAAITGKSAGLTWDVYTITLAVIVGCILFAGFMYVVALISVPVIVYFPAYSIYFFAARYRPLSVALYGPPPEPPLVPVVAPVG